MKNLYQQLCIVALLFIHISIQAQISVDGNGKLIIADPIGVSDFLQFAQGNELYSMDMFTGGLVFRPNANVNLYSVIMTDDTDYPVTFWGKVNLGTQASGIVIEAGSAQALWYDANFFSWGYGKDWNYFADEILIGGEVGPAFTPNNSDGLSIAESKDIRLDGNGVRLIRYTDGATLTGAVGFTTHNFILNNNYSDGDMTFSIQGGDYNFRTNNSSSRLMITESGNVGIGTTTPGYTLQVAGDADITGELTSASDLRLKKNITPIHEALSVIHQLNPVCYEFKSSEFPELKLSERHRMGLIAQEVELVLPDHVSHSGRTISSSGQEIEVMSVNYMEMIPLLIKSIQELEVKLDTVTKSLEDKNREIEKLIQEKSERWDRVELGSTAE